MTWNRLIRLGIIFAVAWGLVMGLGVRGDGASYQAAAFHSRMAQTLSRSGRQGEGPRIRWTQGGDRGRRLPRLDLA